MELDISYVGILKVYAGIDNLPTEGIGPDCDPVDAETGFIIEEVQETVFESGIIKLIEKYETDYETLKSDLGISADSDFTFSFEFANGTIIEPNDVVIPNIDVFASEIPIQYLDKSASLQIGILNVRVW